MDAGNMLKPMLARGELRAIGATTLDEYREHIEKDPALERRFQPVLVEEPSVEDTIGILRGLKERYEVHHGVRIQDPALVAAAVLSDRYVTGRFLPDKAIDLIDEAASRLRIEIDSVPIEVDEVERRIRQLEIERAALGKDDDPASKARLERITEELADLEEQSTAMRAHWEREKELIDRIRQTKEAIEQARMEAERAEREGDLQRVAEIRYGRLVELEKELAEGNTSLADLQADRKMLNEEVTDEDVAQVVAQWTGIPVSRLMEGEMQKLVHLEEHLHERVVGQDPAVTAVANAIRRARAGMQDPNRPIGSFLFLGPTGVGKTELARALAEYLFDDERAIVRIDMSEYQERHTVSRLVGAPPGYVGYEEGGQLTEAVRRRPYSVVLLDEMEKAHGDVFNILLQLLDDGRLTDGHGRTVDFRNTIVIMTSNLGSAVFGDATRSPEEQEADVLAEVRGLFRPEFINRIDEIVVFRPLAPEQIRTIVELQLRSLRERLADRDLTLEVSEAAIDHLASEGYDPAFGARPLRRAIQRQLQDPLALQLLAGPSTTATPCTSTRRTASSRSPPRAASAEAEEPLRARHRRRSRRRVQRQRHRRERILREVELLRQVAEDRDVLPHRGARVRTPVGLGIEPLPAQEQILDELQIGVERQRLVIDRPRLDPRRDREPRHAHAVAVDVDVRRPHVIVEAAPVVPREVDHRRVPIVGVHDRVDHPVT